MIVSMANRREFLRRVPVVPAAAAAVVSAAATRDATFEWLRDNIREIHRLTLERMERERESLANVPEIVTADADRLRAMGEFPWRL